MRQVIGLTSTYSSDEFGICSALYELGGMVVMHDASGCNSTYTTHDEPRWYEQDSMIYISAISEMEAIMGDDEKFIEDLVETAAELQPKFIALVGAPIPYMIGTDLEAIAQIVEQRTGIPTFGFAANGMQYYTKGISMALERLTGYYCREQVPHTDGRLTVNLLGATPLDFSLNGSVQSMEQWLRDQDMEPGVTMAMGCSLEDIPKLSAADVNLVVSLGGLAAAKLLEQRFGIPYVIGVPYGAVFSKQLGMVLRKTAADKQSKTAWEKENHPAEPEGRKRLILIGESVAGVSLACAIEAEYPEVSVRVCCPLDTDLTILRGKDRYTPEEDDIMEAVRQADGVIADPLYRMLCAGKPLYPMGHVAFSGRIYEKEIPNLIGKSLK